MGYYDSLVHGRMKVEVGERNACSKGAQIRDILDLIEEFGAVTHG